MDVVHAHLRRRHPAYDRRPTQGGLKRRPSTKGLTGVATTVSDRAMRRTPGDGSRSMWTAYAAAAWAFLFAVPSFYWAAGGRGGLDSTVSPDLVRLAHDRVLWFLALLWITGAMKAFAGLVALAMVRRWGRIFPGWMLLILAWGAGTLLAWHGALFVGAGSLMLGGFTGGPSNPGLWAVVRWYTFLWGPWFVLGGVLFMAAGWAFMRGLPDQRTGWVSSMLGVLGGLGVSAAMLLLGIG